MANFKIRGAIGLKADLMCDNLNHPLCNMADSDKNFLEFYGATTYRKGSVIGYHLTNLFGSDVFHEVFSRLVKDHQGKHINSAIFFQYFESVLTEKNR